jgi:hypothetical protein
MCFAIAEREMEKESTYLLTLGYLHSVGEVIWTRHFLRRWPGVTSPW